MESYEHTMSMSKAMPVSSLLRNFPPPPSETRDYASLGKDGTDIYDHPPSVFYVNDRVEDTKEYFRKKFAVAEALAKTSLLTSPAAKRRIAARKLEIDNNFSNDSDFEPPKDLLLYLVR